IIIIIIIIIIINDLDVFALEIPLQDPYLRLPFATLEVFRRCVWNVFRMENEHLNNCGKFRILQEIPDLFTHPLASRPKLPSPQTPVHPKLIKFRNSSKQLGNDGKVGFSPSPPAPPSPPSLTGDTYHSQQELEEKSDTDLEYLAPDAAMEYKQVEHMDTDESLSDDEKNMILQTKSAEPAYGVPANVEFDIPAPTRDHNEAEKRAELAILY
ncbi:xenotropic and polytropic murine leukemia virus receptor xpr1, partial [Reticulomyxa filosa]